MLANKLDVYRGRENQYVENNIQKIQELYRNEEHKMESRKKKLS